MISLPLGVGVMSPGPSTTPGHTTRTSSPQRAKSSASSRLWYFERLYAKSRSQASYPVVSSAMPPTGGRPSATMLAV